LNIRPGILAGLSLLASLIPAAAAAVTSTPGAPVVLLGTAEDEPLTGRIAAELRALGIGIEIRVVAGDDRGIEVEVASALREGARAAVRIDAQTGRTEVSIPDPATRQVALKQVLEGPPTAALVPVLAVRTVEFVRATLLGPRNEELRRAGGAGSADASSSDDGITSGPAGDGHGGPAISRLSGLGVALSSGAVFTPGGLDAQFGVGITARVRVVSRLGLEVMAFAPLTTGRSSDGARAPGVQASASTWLAGVGLFGRQSVSNRVGVEVGGGVVRASLRGNGVAPGGTDGSLMSGHEVGASVYGRLGADVALARNLALRLDVLGGRAFREVKFTFDDNDPAPRTAWGASFAAVLGGVEARWF
jgi:hypothetical protein